MPWNRILACALVTVNLVLCYSLFFSEHGLLMYMDTRERQDELQQRLTALDETSLSLSNEIRLLKEDRVYIEKTIREKLNYIRPNEVLYIFPGQDEADAGGARHAGKD